jgi:hypothetical protein
MNLEIPTVPSELEAPVRALARAAYLLRGVFVELAKGRPLEEVLEQRGQYLELAERVLDRWVEHLGIEAEEVVEEVEA